MCFGPSTLGAGAKTRLRSRIKEIYASCPTWSAPTHLHTQSRRKEVYATHPPAHTMSRKLLLFWPARTVCGVTKGMVTRGPANTIYRKLLLFWIAYAQGCDLS